MCVFHCDRIVFEIMNIIIGEMITQETMLAVKCFILINKHCAVVPHSLILWHLLVVFFSFSLSMRMKQTYSPSNFENVFASFNFFFFFFSFLFNLKVWFLSCAFSHVIQPIRRAISFEASIFNIKSINFELNCFRNMKINSILKWSF